MAARQGRWLASMGYERLWRTSVLEFFHNSENYGFYLNAGAGGMQVNGGELLTSKRWLLYVLVVCKASALSGTSVLQGLTLRRGWSCFMKMNSILQYWNAFFQWSISSPHFKKSMLSFYTFGFLFFGERKVFLILEITIHFDKTLDSLMQKISGLTWV